MKKSILLLAIGLVLACSTSDDDDLNSNATQVSSQKLAKIPIVTIGGQKWMLENLNVAHYRNGDVIPQVTDLTEWNGLTTGAWRYYGNDPLYGFAYGKQYNWYAVNDPRGLAPKGFHIPTDSEWSSLTTFLGGESVAGEKLKSTITLWESPNVATNSSGFTALPGGNHGFTTEVTDQFGNVTFFGPEGWTGFWWSSSQFDGTSAWNRSLQNFEANITRNYNPKNSFFSVRCLKN